MRRARPLVVLLLLLAGCSGKGKVSSKGPAAGPISGETSDGYLAMCVVARDLPAAIHEQLIVIARVAGSTLTSVDADTEIPEETAWTPLSGGTAETGRGEVIRDGNVAVVSVGRCAEAGALWSTIPFRRVSRPDGAAADALDRRVADRRAANEREAVGNVETSFSEAAVEWIELPAAPGVVFRVTTLETSLTECETPSEPGADAVCGSLEETRIVVERASVGSAVETAETLLESVGC